MTDPILIQYQIGEMMEASMMDLRVIGILCMTALAIAALVVDGDMGETLMTAVVGAIGVTVGYMFGVKRCENEEEVPK